MKKMRRGFTLVELLVVISVLGALAAMMSMSSSEAITSAKAANIISNLRTMTAAVNEYYADNRNRFYGADADNNSPELAEIQYYMNKGISEQTSVPEAKLDNYYVITDTLGTGETYAGVNWYVGYKFTGNEEDLAVKQKLAKRAKEVGLYGSTAVGAVPTSDSGMTIFEASHAVVWMVAREKSLRTGS